MQNQVHDQRALIMANWRATEMGGFTYPIAVRLMGNRLEVVRPVRREFSRTARHGVWFYNLDDVDVLIHLEQSNLSRRRGITKSYCRLPLELCDRIADAALTKWRSGADVEDVEQALELLQL